MTPVPVNLLYSQIAQRSTYDDHRRRAMTKRINNADMAFPPLPPPPPPPLPLSPPRRQQQHPVVQPLPSDVLLEIEGGCEEKQVASPTPPPRSGKGAFNQFETSVLHDFLNWCDGNTQCLSPLASSALGLDVWTYDLRRKKLPSLQQERMLKQRLLELAHKSPLALHYAIVDHNLVPFLGLGFEWVECNESW